jgi:TolB-like protein
MKRALFTLGAVFAAAAPLLGAGKAEGVVVLPFVNLSGVAGAPAVVSTIVAKGLEARGYRVVDGDSVERFLQSARVRYLDSLAAPVRERLLSEFNAEAVLFAALYQFEGGLNPSAALLLRLVRSDGNTAWERFGALSADETQGMFGIGRLPSVEAVVDRLVRGMEASLPRPGAVASPAAARLKPLGRSGPRTYRSAVLSEGKTQRVIVLPFESGSADPGAGRLTSSLAAFRLRASGKFDVVEPAELRAAILDAGVRSATNPDPGELTKLAGKLGTGLFLTGTVFVYQDSIAGVQAEFEIDLQLVDVRLDRIVWSSHHQRRGKDYEGLLELGTIANAATLADQVLAEMVTALEHAKPKGRETL